MNTTSLHLLDTAVLVLVGYGLFYLRRRSRPPDPPGPPGLPLIGNALQIPKEQQWKAFFEWSQTYGDVLYLNLLGEPTLVLGSSQAAADLLDTRGGIYSDRPAAVMAGELVGWNQGLGYARGPYHARFRAMRRLFNSYIGPRGVGHSRVTHVLRQGTHRLLKRLLEDPKNFESHIQQCTGATILELSYGYDTGGVSDDPLVKIVNVAMDGFSRASQPGAFWVDNFPLLKYVPMWMPGAGFRRIAKRMYADRQEMYDVPFECTNAQLAYQSARPSFTSFNLAEDENSPVDEELVKATAASLYSGGAETTPASMKTFILAMITHPDVEARAYLEIDAVLGLPPSRLPTPADRGSLPYLCAILLEVYRWSATVPLGLPHRLTREDTYRGWRIPKGTVVWANIWAILNDPRVFPEPEVFRPERYLEIRDGEWRLRQLTREEDPMQIAFGFGRRICPGLNLADDALFGTIAALLSLFNFAKARKENGQVIEPEVRFDGFIAHPAPFPCSIEPRIPDADKVLSYLVDQAQGEL